VYDQHPVRWHIALSNGVLHPIVEISERIYQLLEYAQHGILQEDIVALPHSLEVYPQVFQDCKLQVDTCSWFVRRTLNQGIDVPVYVPDSTQYIDLLPSIFF